MGEHSSVGIDGFAVRLSTARFHTDTPLMEKHKAWANCILHPRRHWNNCLWVNGRCYFWCTAVFHISVQNKLKASERRLPTINLALSSSGSLKAEFAPPALVSLLSFNPFTPCLTVSPVALLPNLPFVDALDLPLDADKVLFQFV